MRAIDLFSGVGGMALGFERAGTKVVAAVESDAKHVETYTINFPHTSVIPKDVRQVSAKELHSSTNNSGNIDLVFGGPPCQGFSIMGNRSVDDPRNSLLLEFARIVEELQPMAFVMENVSGILSPQYRGVLRTFYDKLKTAGYVFADEPLVLNAKDFGVPQSRVRVFVVGLRRSRYLLPTPRSTFAETTEELMSPTVRHAIGDLPLLESLDFLFECDRFTDPLGEPSLYATEMRKANSNLISSLPGVGGFLRTRHSEVVKSRFAATRPGAREPVSRFARLDYNSVAPTLRAGTPLSMGKFMAARPIHPIESRCITIREAARLQSFPDWFELHPSRWYGAMQIGNSVPPLLAEAVARSVLDTL